jgi:AraC-like DNA-binding protein
MAQPALTLASTISPIVDYVKEAGGSVKRVFRAAELPIRIVEKTDMLIPLRDQFRLVECAARELGDDALPARLATLAGIDGLGQYGQMFVAHATLGDAIQKGNEIFTSLLQSATCMSLRVHNRIALWTYRVIEPTPIGRQKNEILALGYMLQLLRYFIGPEWTPMRAELTGTSLYGRATIESLFRCQISLGSIASVTFTADHLDAPNPAPSVKAPPPTCQRLPASEDFIGYLEELIMLNLLEGRPQREAIAHRLNMSVRTFHRRLSEHNTSFGELTRAILERQATELLRNKEMPVSQIAYELGYSDPAHFTRAFAHWFGEAPQSWRRNRCAAANTAS